MSEARPIAAGPASRAVLRLLQLSRFVQSFAYSATFPYLVIYLTEERGLPASTIGLVYALLWSALALSQAGTTALRRGHGSLIAASLCARGGVSIVLWSLISLDAPMLPLVAALLVSALLAGLYPASADGLVLRLAPPLERTTEFARQRVATHLGWILGPAAGGLLSGYTSMAVLFLATAPLYALAGVPFLRGRCRRGGADPRTAAPNPAPAAWADLHLTLHLTAALLAFSLAGQLNLALILHGTEQLHVSEAQLGVVWTMSAALVVLMQVPAASLMRRRGPYHALIISSLLSGAAYALVGLTADYAHLIFCILFIALADLLGAPAHQEAVARGAADEDAGRRVGLISLVLTLGRAVGPLMGGISYELCSERPRLLWALMGALWVIAAGLYAGAARQAALKERTSGDASTSTSTTTGPGRRSPRR